MSKEDVLVLNSEQGLVKLQIEEFQICVFMFLR